MSLATILVEDSRTIRDNLIAALMEFSDIEILATAESAAEATQAARLHTDRWNLMILDLFLKEGSGLTVLRALQDRRADQQIVVLTNYATQDIRNRCSMAGANAVFDKSTELEAFFGYLSKPQGPAPGDSATSTQTGA